jgi:hypothetical protein
LFCRSLSDSEGEDKIKGHPTRRQVISLINFFDRVGLPLYVERGVAIFAKACFGHPSPSKRQKLNATANAFGAPIRPRHLVQELL